MQSASAVRLTCSRARQCCTERASEMDTQTNSLQFENSIVSAYEQFQPTRTSTPAYQPTSLPPAYQFQPVSSAIAAQFQQIENSAQFQHGSCSIGQSNQPVHQLQPSTPDPANQLQQSLPALAYQLQQSLPAAANQTEPTSYNTSSYRSWQFPEIEGQFNKIDTNTQSQMKLEVDKFDWKSEFSCSQCGKKYKNKSSLKYHIKMHLDTTKHFCNICKQFKPSETYLEHNMFKCARLIQHERRFKCELCGKKFKTLGVLRTHEKIHQEPQHACRFCGRRFVQKRNAELHEMRRHNLQITEIINIMKLKMFHNLLQSLKNKSS